MKARTLQPISCSTVERRYGHPTRDESRCNRARLGARLARAVVQSAFDLVVSTQDRIAGHLLDTSLLRRTEILPRKPFKAVARVQIPLGPPLGTSISEP